MSGNSADSLSEDSEREEVKEEVKEKAEVIVKKKGPGRPPRKKRPPVPSPVSPTITNSHKRRCNPPKSGKHNSQYRFNLVYGYMTFSSVMQGSVAC